MAYEDVGVVVIGRNEGARLVRCLESLAHCRDALVYVDSGSTDGSIEAARRLGAHIVELDLSCPFTAARARNAGYEALKGLKPEVQFVQFVDGDCEIAADWIGTARAFLRSHPDVAVACGRRRERYPEASLYNRLCDDEWNTPVGEALACGGDSLVRAGAFADAGGFRPDLIAGEEPELCVRIRQRGWQIWRLDAEMTLHDAALTRFGEWWQRNVRAGYAFAAVSRLHRHSPHGIWRREVRRAVLWGGVLPALICAGVFLHPAALVAVGIYPIQVARIAALRNWAAPQSWIYAAFVMLAKLPELQGLVQYATLQLSGRNAALIEYK
jgi:glycosyltransferase involved in cell wall biosynthesis